MPPSAMCRTSLSFSAKSSDRRESFFRASGGTGRTPRKSKGLLAAIDILAAYYESEIKLQRQLDIPWIARAAVLAEASDGSEGGLARRIGQIHAGVAGSELRMVEDIEE